MRLFQYQKKVEPVVSYEIREDYRVFSMAVMQMLGSAGEVFAGCKSNVGKVAGINSNGKRSIQEGLGKILFNVAQVLSVRKIDIRIPLGEDVDSSKDIILDGTNKYDVYIDRAASLLCSCSTLARISYEWEYNSVIPVTQEIIEACAYVLHYVEELGCLVDQFDSMSTWDWIIEESLEYLSERYPSLIPKESEGSEEESDTEE